MKTQNTFALESRVAADGIVIYQRDKPNIGFHAFINQNGEIETERLTDNISEISYYDCLCYSFFSNWKLALFALGCLVLSSLLTIWANMTYVSLCTGIFFAFVFPNCWWAISSYILIKKGNPEEISKAKYHGAVHKVLDACEKSGKMPTIEEARLGNCITTNCKSLFFLNKAIMFLLYDLIIFAIESRLISSAFIFLIIPLIFMRSNKNPIVKKIERAIVLEPDEEHLNCALKALDSYYAFLTLTGRTR